MKKKIKRAITLTIGGVFILLGIAGLFLPFLQGILFLIIGLAVLSKESKTAHRILQRSKEKYPGIYSKATDWTHKLRRRFGMSVRE